MNFVYPTFLFALFAIAIPIIIHLFNFRKYKKVYFSNIRFLQEVKQETKRKSKLKHLLVLLSRIIAITALVFAFAQPYLPVSNAKINANKNRVSIFVDNSFSMEAINKNGILLEVAKNKAKEIVAAFQPTDEFQVITNDFETKHQHFVSKKEMEELINEIKNSSISRKLSEVISRQYDLMNDNAQSTKSTYIISDFQKNTSNILEIKGDSSINTFLIPVLTNKTNNIFVDSCWFTSPIQQLNHEASLIVRIKNASDEKLENIPVKLFINNQQKSLASVNIDANSEAEITLSYMLNASGIQNGRIEISDSPIIYDDVFYFNYEIVDKISVLCINGSSPNIYLNTLFGKDSLFAFQNINDKVIDFSSFSSNDLIILNELETISSGLSSELQRYIYDGGSVVLIPSPKADLIAYKTFLTSVNSDFYTGIDTSNTKVSEINQNHPIYKGVFENIPDNVNFPTVYAYYKLSKITNSNLEYLIRLQNANYFFTSQSVHKGKLYLSAVPLSDDFSNFPKNTIFMPTFYNMALLSTPIGSLYYIIGDDKPISLRKLFAGNDDVYHIKSINAGFDVIPEYQFKESQIVFYTHNQIKEAGNYFLVSDNKNIKGLSFNYNRIESELNFYQENEIIKLIESKGLKNFSVINNPNKTLTELISEQNQGKRLWKWFIMMALFFLGVEVCLLRFIK
jgi:hypothetical protein